LTRMEIIPCLGTRSLHCLSDDQQNPGGPAVV
jgi:hypothetical protein